MQIDFKENTNNLQKLEKILEEIKNKKVRIGIFGAEDSHILMVASVQEFGCNITITPKMRAWLNYNGLHVKKSKQQINIPERSFIRRTPQEKQTEINNIIKDGLIEVFNFNIDVTTFYNRIGQYLVGLTQEVLTNISLPPNNEFTIKRKNGKSNPLIDTGRMRSSITWKVE